MPVYIVYHRPLLQGRPRPDLAKALTNLHCEITGAAHESVKVIFVQLDRYTFYSGGEDKYDYVRVVGQIRRGRTADQKMSLLSGMYELTKTAFRLPAAEIQTQIIEIDDTATVMTNAAEPILASTLWTSRSATDQCSKTPFSHGNLFTRCRKIDYALGHGLSYGSVCCISGESDAGVQELSQALLISQLLNSTHATATIIDTGLSMDVRKLHKALSVGMSDEAESNAADHAAKALDRVKIMKVFDFIGLTECLAELRDDLEGRRETSNTTLGSKSEAPEGTIGDSEDEGEGEMLDAPRSLPKPSASSTRSPTGQNSESSLLIINTITQVAAPIMKTNYVQGQALLASFMRSLSHLTKTHNICTVLINGVASNSKHVRDEALSIFSSCTLQPTLGRAFAYMLDVHLLVHKIHRTSGAVGAAGVQDEGDNGRVEKVSVLEILHDRHGGHSGKWAAFAVDIDGELRDIS